jgi:endoglucanase
MGGSAGMTRNRLCDVLARIVFTGFAAASCIGIGPAAAAAGRSPILWGVADSGLEFGRGMKAGTNYSIPDPSYYLQHNVRLIRLPFQIGRIQPQPQGPLDPAFVGAMKRILRLDQDHGAITVLDPHAYGFYNIDGKPSDLLKDPAAAADYVDLMRRIAATFAHDDVAIGLMNEPHTGSDLDYSGIWNQAIAAIRSAGFSGTIVVPHAHWSNAADISLAHPFIGHIVDPLHNWVLEVHLYLDPDSTGTYRQPVANADIGRQRLSGAIAWSRQSGVKLFLGETGGPPDALGLSGMHAVLSDVAAAPDVFWGIALWGAGAWWKPNYPMRLDPVDGVPRPQFIELEHMFLPELLYFAKPPGQASTRIAVFVDGRAVDTDIGITADVTDAPQSYAVVAPLAPGTHRIDIRPVPVVPALTAYVLASTWHGAPDSQHAFGVIDGRDYSFAITVPPAGEP